MLTARGSPFHDNTAEDLAEALNRVGGARAVLATVTNTQAMSRRSIQL
jgi:hypothetical protein